MARTNYSYEKRQKEIAKQKKTEEKRLKKLQRRQNQGDETVPDEGISREPGDQAGLTG